MSKAQAQAKKKPTKHNLEVKMVPIGSIRQYENNPRINDQAVDAVARSIEAFGFRQPIVVDKKGVIIVGHTRYKAAIKLGMKEVPVHVADMKPAEAKAYRIADNKTGDLAQFDFGLLEREMDELGESGFDLSLTGFTDKEIAEFPGNVEAPEAFPEVGEGIDTDHECPKCGYKWSGGK
jgi:ParB-like chromosome segregation protein Spo0J